MSRQRIVDAEAQPVSWRELPAPAKEYLDPQWYTTQILFYQYVEPLWSRRQLLQALHEVERLAKEHDITGRGRIALEGLNCTLTAPATGARAFCAGLRDWDRKLFGETDFKFTDGVPASKKFKALTIKRTDELVAYGLEGEKAPLLKQNGAKHVDAVTYHDMLTKPNTVVIDVRNAYESDIGRIEPPKGGAELIDPQMRNSHEFPKWLNMPETQKKLEGKHVMMYCTGGIRCERASALLDTMHKASDGLNINGISMVRGGIDRYLKTFPEGGFWKGKNYLFDLREEQEGEAQKQTSEIRSQCCICSKPWDVYQGKFQCNDKRCKVPVLVCNVCISTGAQKYKRLLCPLCKSGHSLRDKDAPDMVLHKRQLATRGNQKKRQCIEAPARRLFMARLPLCVSRNDLATLIPGVIESVHWLVDKSTGFFYGSAFVQMKTLDEAKAVYKLSIAGTLQIRNRRIPVNYAPTNAEWPPADHVEQDWPPLPSVPTPQ